MLSVGGVVLVWSHADKGDPFQHASTALNAVLIVVFGASHSRGASLAVSMNTGAGRCDSIWRWAVAGSSASD